MLQFCKIIYQKTCRQLSLQSPIFYWFVWDGLLISVCRLPSNLFIFASQYIWQCKITSNHASNSFPQIKRTMKHLHYKLASTGVEISVSTSSPNLQSLPSSPPSIPSSSQHCVCVSRGSWLTPDPGLMRAITRIKRGWLEGVWEWGLNNYTGLPTCLSSWLRKLQSPSLSPPTLFQSAHKRKGLWKIINYLGATLTWM